MTSTATDTTVRRRRSFSRKDRLTLSAFVGIPTAFHILLVWVPAIGTIGLSFKCDLFELRRLRLDVERLSFIIARNRSLSKMATHYDH